jgi:sugar phosphate isomerase/epimerase
MDVLAACWTTSGDSVPLPGRHLSPLPLKHRIAEAARAGFTGMGILDVDLEAFLADSSLADLKGLLDDAGIVFVEVEFIVGWWLADDAARAASDRCRAFLLQTAEALGAHHIKIGPDLDASGPYDADEWAERLNGLATEAADHGTLLSFEFMPFSNVPTLAAAVDLVQRADHPAAGLCLDTWHTSRAGTPLAEIAALPAGVITAVELDDGTRDQVGDAYDDTVLRRRYPGDGEFDVSGFVSAVAAAGWDGPWGVEIISEAHRVRPLEESLPEVYASTRRAVTDAGH